MQLLQHTPRISTAAAAVLTSSHALWPLEYPNSPPKLLYNMQLVDNRLVCNLTRFEGGSGCPFGSMTCAMLLQGSSIKA